MDNSKVFYSKLDDTDGCITNTHECPYCTFNQSCTSSTQSSVQEPSPSDWAQIDCASNLEQRYD